MNSTEIKIIETVIAVVVFFLLRLILIKSIDKTVTRNLLQKTRGKIIKKVTLLILIIVFLIFILTIWGVERSELFMFMASVLTVIGITLFAQWSHLSNITSGVIIFFNHSVKLDDTVIIMDKDFEIEGRISDIGLFFIKLKTKEHEDILLPNNIFLQKMIKKKTI